MSKGEASQRLKRRGRIGRLLFWAFAIAAIVAVFLIAKCGGGFGFGKGGMGSGQGSASKAGSGAGAGAGTATGAAKARCLVRVDGNGLTVDGTLTTVEAVIAACKKATAGADVIVAGDARQATWEELRAALDGAGIASLVRGAGAPAATVDAGTDGG
jgi:hypothetical protein